MKVVFKAFFFYQFQTYKTGLQERVGGHSFSVQLSWVRVRPLLPGVHAFPDGHSDQQVLESPSPQHPRKVLQQTMVCDAKVSIEIITIFI